MTVQGSAFFLKFSTVLLSISINIW